MEIRKDVLGYEGIYKISNYGNIKSIKFNKAKILSPGLQVGYPTVNLWKNGIKKQMKVHRIVLEGFIGISKLEVNHINGIKNDNRLCNLEYISHSGNLKHNYRVLGYKPTPLGRFGMYHNCAKKVNQYTKDGEFIKQRGSFMDIERGLGKSRVAISDCCRGKIKSSGGYKREYAQ